MIKRFKLQFIILLYVMTFVALGLILFFTYNEALFLIKEQLNNQQMIVAKQTAGGIEKTVKSYVRSLEYITDISGQKNLSKEDLRSFIEETFGYIKTPYVKELIFIDAGGTVKISLIEPRLEGSDYAAIDYFKKAKASRKRTLIFEFITLTGVDAGKKGVIAANPVFSQTGEFRGVVALTLKINELIKSYVPFEISNSKSYVVSSDGDILCNPADISNESMQRKKNLVTSPQNPMSSYCPNCHVGSFFGDVKAGKVFSGEYTAPAGNTEIAVSYPISIADQKWSIVIATPTEVLHNLLSPFSTKFTLATFLILLVLVGGSIYVISLTSKWNAELDSMVKIRTQELSLSEEKLRDIVDTINELIWETDADGKYVYVSPAAKKILGYQPEELIGTTIFETMEENDAQQFRKTLQGIVPSKKSFNGLQRVSRHRKGRHIILETNGALILDDNGNLKGFRGADRDITMRKEAEQELQKYAAELIKTRDSLEQKVEERTLELRRAHEALIRKEKLAVLGQLAASISHELRNPLGVIKNAVYFFNMKINSFDDPSVRENIKIITREIDTANKIIVGLLDFTRDKPPVHLDININQLLTEILSKQFIPDTVQVATDFAENLAPVIVDPTQIAQVFMNLIENAVQAMEQGGTLKMSTRANGKGIEIVVADNGCGIAPDNLGYIFDPLFTTKTKGIGLGLALSKSLIEANGGTIGVESVAGAGTTFTVVFQGKA